MKISKIRTILDYLIMSTVLLCGIIIIRCGSKIETSTLLEIVVTLHGFLLIVITLFVYIIYVKLSKLEVKEK